MDEIEFIAQNWALLSPESQALGRAIGINKTEEQNAREPRPDGLAKQNCEN